MTPAPASTAKSPASPRSTPKPAVSRRPSSAAPSTMPEAPADLSMTERLKGWFDWPVSLVLLVLSSPVILFAMLLIKLTSRGPAIYTQSRVGRGGAVFTIYKLRTMSHECESITGARWSMPGDPRITPLGYVLRILHIDELPQLVNVLKGEMSLIGPRPERPEICKELRRSIVNYDLRHTVKPGITGFAQIHLPPDVSIRSVKNKLVYDRFYIQRMGLGIDLYILFCTLLKVVHLRGLYCRPPRIPA